MTDPRGFALLPATTDAIGRYTLDQLPPGRYFVRAAKAGFTTTFFGAIRSVGPGTPVVLEAAERFDAPIVLPRASVVTGTIIDEHGEPAVATVVFLIRRPSSSRSPPLVEFGRTESDRSGRYRIEGLPAGNYVVRAERPNVNFDVRRISPEEVAAARASGERGASAQGGRDLTREATYSYLPVYYPGVASSITARTIAIEPAVERHGIDLQLQVVQTISFEGALLDPAGNPLANATTRLLGDDEGLERYGTTTANGRFRFVGVPPGRYVLAARSPLPLMPDGKRTVLWGSQELIVSPGARIDPVLTFHPGADLTGQMAFDGAAAIPDFRSTSTLVQLTPIGGLFTRFGLPQAGINLQEVGGPLRAFGLRFDGVPPGRYVIVCPPTLPGGWSFRSAMLEGVDVSAAPFDVASGSRLDGLVVTFTDRHTSLSGTVKNEIGEPVFAHTLVVFPSDRRAWHGAAANRIRLVPPDSRGKYAIADLPAGDYLVALARELNPAEIVLSETLNLLEPGALRVRLVEGQPTVQDLQTRSVR